MTKTVFHPYKPVDVDFSNPLQALAEKLLGEGWGRQPSTVRSDMTNLRAYPKTEVREKVDAFFEVLAEKNSFHHQLAG